MKWFVAKIVFRIISGDGLHGAQFDEQLRIINGTNKQQALQKAIEIGVTEQESFINQKGQMVHWKFINVSEVYALQTLSDGAELYSRIEEKENALQYEDLIHTKAAQLTYEVNTPNLQHI